MTHPRLARCIALAFLLLHLGLAPLAGATAIPAQAVPPETTQSPMDVPWGG